MTTMTTSGNGLSCQGPDRHRAIARAPGRGPRPLARRLGQAPQHRRYARSPELTRAEREATRPVTTRLDRPEVNRKICRAASHRCRLIGKPSGWVRFQDAESSTTSRTTSSSSSSSPGYSGLCSASRS